MKKNVKFLGAAAAALLAVAPVAVSGVANAASIDTNPNAPVAPSKKDQIQVNFTVTNANQLTAGDPVSKADYSITATVNGKTLSVVPGPNAKVYAIPSDKPAKPENAVNTFAKNTKYYMIASGFYISGLDATKEYTFNIGTGANQIGLVQNGPITNPNQTFQSSQQGTIGTTKESALQFWSAPFLTTGNPAAIGTPFFTATSDNTVIPTSSSYNGPKGTGVALSENSVDTVYNTLTDGSVVKFNGGGANNTFLRWDTSKADVEKQMKDAGVTVYSDGSFKMPAGGFNVTLTGISSNGEKASVTVHFAGTTADAEAYPVIFGHNVTAYGIGNQTHNFVKKVAVGSNFGSEEALKGFAAQVSRRDNSNLTIFVASNKVNTNVPGVYPVTLKATNPAGLSTELTYYVQVGNTDATYKQVQYVKGYFVNVWGLNTNANGKTSVAYASRVEDGKYVATYDSKVVDGVEYTRIGSKNANTWIQTKYLNGSWINDKNEQKPATDVSKEEAMHGVIEVVYNGRGGVKLLNGKGQYQDQVVKNGAKYKVFAKKTINGKEYYRLGTDNQWIPAQYAEVR